MERGQKVYHKRHPQVQLTIVSPPSSNGYEIMVCEVFDSRNMCFWIITDKPENFI
jgi:hypothetical protein